MSIRFIFLLCTMLFNILCAFSSNSFFILWLFIELNTIIFLFFVYLYEKEELDQTGILYFIPQVLASGALVFFILLHNFFLQSYIILYTFFLVLLLKIGLPPFSKWIVIFIIKNRSYMNIWLALTLQKLLPLIFFSTVVNRNFSFSLMVVGVLYSSIQMLKALNVKKILVWSSVMNTYWMLVSLTSINVFFINFVSYLLSVSITCLFIAYAAHVNYSFTRTIYSNNNLKVTLLCLVGILANIPPLVTFWPKVIIISIFLETGYYSILFGITLIITVFYTVLIYLKLCVGSLYFERNSLFPLLSSNSVMFNPIILLFFFFPILFLLMC